MNNFLVSFLVINFYPSLTIKNPKHKYLATEISDNSLKQLCDRKSSARLFLKDERKAFPSELPLSISNVGEILVCSSRVS
jgi:hypothetical protein